ncbi:MAG: polysaccharide deacetylase [Acidobacteriales bacterium]|nr:polysaccharide deacetylase [Terriglobales bacterium]
MLNAITVDVEDYFHTEAMSEAVRSQDWDSMPSHVEASTNQLLEIFSRNGVKATLFFLGWVAEKFPELVRQAVREGHEIGCHSYWHRAVFRLTPEEFLADTKRAKDAIEDAGGVAINGYRAPSFSLIPGTEWAADILQQLGFTYDSSVNPIRHDFYSNQDAPRIPYLLRENLWEFPIATVRFGEQNLPIGGGAYLRILPLKYSTWGISRLNEVEKCAGMFYLHPWEIDAAQPRLPVKLKSKIRQYTGLSGMAGKLEQLLKDFSFGPVRDAFQSQLQAPALVNAAAGVVG